MKLEYKIEKEKRSIEVNHDISWEDFCKSTDLVVLMNYPNENPFSYMVDFIMLWTGKNSDQMQEWKDASKSQVLFVQEIKIVFDLIIQNTESKKK